MVSKAEAIACIRLGWERAWALRKRFVFAGQSHSIIPDQVTRNEVILRAVADFFSRDDKQPRKVLFDWTTKIAEINSHMLRSSTLANVIEQGNYEEPLDRIVDELQAMASRPEIYPENFKYDLERDLRQLSVPTLILEIATSSEDRLLGRQGPSFWHC
jgi:hypothetical protein